jgi:hypothetical protein
VDQRALGSKGNRRADSLRGAQIQGSAKVQLRRSRVQKCKGELRGRGRDRGWGRENFRVRVQVRDLNFTRDPHLDLNTRARDLRAETWGPKICGASRRYVVTRSRPYPYQVKAVSG